MKVLTNRETVSKPCTSSQSHRVTALVSEPTADQFASRYDFEVEPVLPEPLSMYHPLRVLQQVPSLRSELADADAVHSFITYPYLPAAALALAGRDTPLTVTALGTYAVNPLRSFWTRQLLYLGYRRCRTVFAISDYTERRIVDRLGLDNTTVLPLGIDHDRFGTETPGDEGYILSVGGIKRRKGFDTLIRAFARVAPDFPQLDLNIVGPVHDEAYGSMLKSFVEEHGLEKRFQFLGNLKDRERLVRLYRDCTFFALTPREVDDNFEGFGLVYLEAAAYGKPSVATRSGGVPTAVRDGETGLLAPEDDVDALGEALGGLLDPDRRETLGRNARAYAESLDWNRYADPILRAW